MRKITIRVIADADGQGTPGVEITLVPAGGPSQSVNYTWELLDGLLDDPTKESYARIAAFAYSFLRVVYEQGGLVIQALELLRTSASSRRGVPQRSSSSAKTMSSWSWRPQVRSSRAVTHFQLPQLTRTLLIRA